MDPARRAFYEFHACVMEAWDGPACVSFTDGTVIGAVLDRNGLRPGRWWQTSDGLVVLGSESGVLDLDPATVVAKGRLQPGRMFLVDTERGEIRSDERGQGRARRRAPYDEWLHAGLIHLADLPAREHVVFTHESVTRRQQIFGYTEEELRILLAPMATAGAEPIGSMGTDTPPAALSKRPRLLFDYFTELFAQVTNPPLDAIREELVTSLAGGDRAGAEPARARAGVVPADRDPAPGARQRRTGQDLAHQRRRRHARLPVRARSTAGTACSAAARHSPPRSSGSAASAPQAIEAGARILILSDRDCDADHAPIPSLLLTSAVHQHLVRTGQRTQVGLIVETGEAREVHHIALLIGYGAAAVNPYLAFESIEDLVAGRRDPRRRRAGRRIANYVKALARAC